MPLVWRPPGPEACQVRGLHRLWQLPRLQLFEASGRSGARGGREASIRSRPDNASCQEMWWLRSPGGWEGFT